MNDSSRPGRLAGLVALLRDDGLKSRAFRGSALTLLQFGIENIQRLAANLILTRLLFPEAFGLMTLVSVVLIGVAMFSDIGTSSAIIQNKRGEEPAFLNTAWTLQVVRGFVLWLVILALAHPMASFYEEPMLALMLPVAGLTAIIDGLRSTRPDVLNRRMQLGRVTAFSIGAQTFSLIVTSVLAWQMQSVWALVVGQVSASVLTTLLSHTVYPGEPNRFRVEADAFRSLFRYGKYIFFATIAGFLVAQGDRAILGKYVDLADLAFYNIAFFFANAPIMLATTLSNRIIFPLYVNRPPSAGIENRRKIAKVRVLISALMFALFAFLGVISEDLIEWLYDERYYSAGLILVMLVLASIPQVITQSYPALLLAAGDSRNFAILVSLRAATNVVLMLLTVPLYGVAGVAVSLFLSAFINYPITAWFAHGKHGWDPYHDAAFLVLAAVISALLVWLHPAVLSEFHPT